MALSVGTVLKVVAVLQWLDGDIMQNVFNAVIGGTGGPYDDADVVDDMVDWVEDMFANITGVQTNQLDGSEVRVYEYDFTDEDWDEVGSDPWVYNPTGTGEQQPRGVAALINAKTTDPDVNGKKYIGGITEDWTADALWQSAVLAFYAAFALDWGTGFTGATSAADFQPVIWSPTRGNAFVMTNTFIVPAIPAYQRRRKRGVGI